MMSDDKISSNEAIDAALHLDGDPERVKQFYEDWAKNYNIDTSGSEYTGPAIAANLLQQHLTDKDSVFSTPVAVLGWLALNYKHSGMATWMDLISRTRWSS